MNAYVLNNIANLLAKMKVFNQAETTYKSALAILLPIFGNFHPLVATNQYSTFFFPSLLPPASPAVKPAAASTSPKTHSQRASILSTSFR